MSETGKQHDNYRERVLDRGLAETVGDDLPPDLSERILDCLSTKETNERETVMADRKDTAIVSKRHLFAIAASLLIIVGGVYLLLPNFKDFRESASLNSTTDWLPPGSDEAEIPATTMTNPQDQEPDFDALLGLVKTTVSADTWDDEGGPGKVEQFPTNLSLEVSQSQQVHDPEQPGSVYPVADLVVPVVPDKPFDHQSAEVWEELTARRKKYSYDGIEKRGDALRMMVTPNIVIQEEQEARLGTYGRDARQGQYPYFTTDLDIPFRNEMFDLKGLRQDEDGRGPGQGGDQYSRIVENPFLDAAGNPLSTFSIDVDTASYANVRQYLTQSGQLPPSDAVRIEELINYFHYEYAAPTSESEPPFAANMEVTSCPWQPKHRLLRIGLKGREIPGDQRPPSNLVFLVDVSGSMDEPNKLPLVVRGLKTLAEHLGENDRVAIVVYASAEGLVLDSTPATRAHEVLIALDQLEAGGSTNGGAGIELAYRIAADHFIQGGTNRLILCTDGDFNVGTTSNAALERLAEEKAKSGVFLTVLGFGRGNLNDQMMETISGRGNGNYHYVDSDREAQKVLIEEMGGTLVTIAKDVKIQVEFNPAAVAAYRLVGYENRILAKEDFNDDTKDAGEIGAGHTVTAIYELVPPGVENGGTPPNVDPLKYQRPAETTEPSDAAASGELLTLKLRYKEPDGDASRLLTFPLTDDGQSFGQASEETKFAASVAMFGMLLRNSRYKGNATYDAAAEIAGEGLGEGEGAYRAEFIELIRRAKALTGR